MGIGHADRLSEAVSFERTNTEPARRDRFAAVFITSLLGAGLLVLVAAVIVTQRMHISLYLLVADGNAVAGLNPLVGSLSYLGILGWWAAAVVWGLAAWAQSSLGNEHLKRFALASAALSTYLALDDLFEFHETLAPSYLHIREQYVYAALIVATIVYVVAFWNVIRATAFPLMVLALTLFAAGVLADKVPDFLQAYQLPYKNLLEDGTKWMGILAWFGYAVLWTRARVLEPIRKLAER